MITYKRSLPISHINDDNGKKDDKSKFETFLLKLSHTRAAFATP
jgi:hypothetical protein